MDKNQNTHKIVILSEHEKVDAEEYVQDTDHVYRKKEEVFKKFNFNTSNFWLRIACFFGLGAMGIVCVLRLVKLLLSIIFSAFQHFKDKALNQHIRSGWNDFKNASMVLVGLSVGVINPRWGMRLMSLFFSVKGQTKESPFLNKIFRFSGF